jgi:tetratricopeptide (TPR) repeat protein
VLFLRGILNFALHRFYDAICDFERVIDKAEDTSAEHYLARGRCYACLSMFKEAITDLSIAINLNKDLLDAYLNRGKCAYLIGDTGLAFMDFQKLIVLQPKNPSVHIYAGNLLMTTGSYEDATKAFTNADNIEQSPLALYQRSRCHVALNNMPEALEDLNKVIAISPNDKVAIQDRECLNALDQCSLINKEPETRIEKQNFSKACQAITKLISYEKNENLAKLVHESSIAHHHSQIIPSANRTKMDKIRAIKRRKEQDIQNKQAGGHGPRKNDLRFRVQQ